VPRECRAGLGTAQEVQKALCVTPGDTGQRRRVANLRMAFGRECPDDTDARLGARIGFVHDAERRLAGRDIGERDTDVLRARQPIPDPRPAVQRLQRGLRVSTGRHDVRVGHRETTLSERAAQIEPIDNFDPRCAVGRGDQHQPIPGDVASRSRRDQLAVCEIVHPLEIGGYE
jgi:hypothetical protein